MKSTAVAVGILVAVSVAGLMAMGLLCCGLAGPVANRIDEATIVEIPQGDGTVLRVRAWR